MDQSPTSPDVLRSYLRRSRDALLSKLDGLGERDVRLPRTPTGVSLAGLVRHCANAELAYFGETFGREFPEPDHPCLISLEEYRTDAQVDWVLPADVSVDQLRAFYGQVVGFVEGAFDELPLDAPGRVSWWSEEQNPVTLHRIAVHMHDDLARHAGHADILREQIDGVVGLTTPGSNVPGWVDWPSYVEKVRAIAEGFPA